MHVKTMTRSLLGSIDIYHFENGRSSCANSPRGTAALIFFFFFLQQPPHPIFFSSFLLPLLNTPYNTSCRNLIRTAVLIVSADPSSNVFVTLCYVVNHGSAKSFVHISMGAASRDIKQWYLGVSFHRHEEVSHCNKFWISPIHTWRMLGTQRIQPSLLSFATTLKSRCPRRRKQPNTSTTKSCVRESQQPMSLLETC